MIALYIAAGVLGWIGCGLLAVYLAARDGERVTNTEIVGMMFGLLALALVAPFAVAKAGECAHRRRKERT